MDSRTSGASAGERLAEVKLKWPGLFPFASRIIAFPFAAVLAGIAVVIVMMEDGLEWWKETLRK